MARERELPPPLEMMCLNALWELGEGTVEEVRKTVSVSRPLAYTTVMTVLTRLWQKGYLDRQQEGRSYLYEALPEDDIRRELGGRAVREALAKFGTPALTGFVRTLSPEQRALVATLLREQDDPESEDQP